MKSTSFDELTRSLAGGTSRRQVLKLLTTGVAGGFLAIKDATDGSAAAKSSVASSLSSTSSGNTVIGPNTFEVLPYRAPGYRFKIISPNRRPPVGFEADDFDDRGFDNGTAAFGSTGAACPLQVTVATLWPVRSQLIVRHSFFLPTGATDVRLMMSIDNDLIKVFVNGVLLGNATHEKCPVLDEFQLTVPGSLVRPGLNLIAVHARDRGVESFFDMRVLADLPAGPLTGGLTPEIVTPIQNVAETVLPLAPLSNFSVACDDAETRVAFFIEKTRESGELRFRVEADGRQTTTTAQFLINGTLILIATRINGSNGSAMTVQPGTPGSGTTPSRFRTALDTLPAVMRHSAVLLALRRCSARQPPDLLVPLPALGAPFQTFSHGEDESVCVNRCSGPLAKELTKLGLLDGMLVGGAAALASIALGVAAAGVAVVTIPIGVHFWNEFNKCVSDCKHPPDTATPSPTLPPCDDSISSCLPECPPNTSCFGGG